MKFIKKHFNVIVLLLLIIISSIYLIFKGMPYQHDIAFHYGRLSSLIRTIRNGDILALIHDTFYGYGYALGLFYSNFFFYIPAFLSLLGVPVMVSYKIFLVLINIGTTLITYFCSKKIIKNDKFSILTTILYSLSLYRMSDIFVRAAMGEVLAFMIVPLVLLGIYEILLGDYHKWYYFTFGFVLLLLSHMITSIIMAFISIVIILFYVKRLFKEPIRFKYLLLSGVLGLLLGIHFIGPILEQYFLSDISIFVVGSQYVPSLSALSFFDLIIPQPIDKFYLGLSIILLIPIRLFYRKKNVDTSLKTLVNFSDLLLILGIIIWFLVSNIFPWKFFDNILSFIQFPWRLLLFATLFFSFSICINLYILSRLGKIRIVKISSWIIVLLSILTLGLYSVQYGIRKIHYDSFELNNIGTGEYLLYQEDKIVVYPNSRVVSNNSDLIFDYDKVGTSIKLKYSNNTLDNTYVDIPLLNYLGYDITSPYEIEFGDNRCMRVYLKDQEGEFEIYYKGTLIQKVSYIVSGTSFVIFIILGIRKKLDKI